ncbi:hypothetical protein SK128_003490 [Halocaridina rubra]|uniref:Uncharacterized protein n=1 Tax=Halocaridina rubra TaxID=373956 RepID=A0AAN9AB62_HALRR
MRGYSDGRDPPRTLVLGSLNVRGCGWKVALKWKKSEEREKERGREVQTFRKRNKKEKTVNKDHFHLWWNSSQGTVGCSEGLNK